MYSIKALKIAQEITVEWPEVYDDSNEKVFIEELYKLRVSGVVVVENLGLS